jgi:protein-tyrosine phosphatase
VAVLDIVPSAPFIYWDDTEIRQVVMNDDWYQPLDGVDELARWVNEKRKEGRVLVKCAAGLNRCSVVAARALMLEEGLTGREAIDLIREKRDPMALCNQMFEEWLLSLDRSEDGEPA